MKIAVTGGTGFVGGFIVDRLLSAGHEVRLMVRPGGTTDRDLETRVLALEPDTDYRPLVQGTDALVHAAFDHLPGRYRQGEGDDLPGFLRKNVAGSLALMGQAQRAGIGRAVILSSRAVYGRRPPGTVLAEDMAVRPDTHYGAAKAALEAFVSSSAAQDGWPVCALRPTGVYGLANPVQRSKWFTLVGDILAGRPVAATGGTEVHGADVAEAVLLLLRAPEEAIAGAAHNCSDLYVSTRDIAAQVQKRSGRRISLPPSPRDAKSFNRMDCSRLGALGITFGGRALFETAIDALTDFHLTEG